MKFLQYLIRIMRMKKNLIQNSGEKYQDRVKSTTSNKSQKEGRISEKVFFKNQMRRKIIVEASSSLSFIHQLVSDIEKQFADLYLKLKQQFELQSSVKGPYVLKNVEIGFEKRKIFIIQQYYDCTLADLPLENLSFQTRLKIFYDIAQGVKDLHNNLICHNALNPQNICLVKDSQGISAKINYFQNALKLEGIKSNISSAAPGKRVSNREFDQFSSPQFRDNRSHGMMTDIWSLGAILNYLLYETMKNIWEEDGEFKVEVPEGTPVWLFELLKFMLHYSPQNRYSLVTVIDILKISLKCLDSMGKFIPTGKKLLKFNRMQTKLNNCSQEWL